MFAREKSLDYQETTLVERWYFKPPPIIIIAVRDIYGFQSYHNKFENSVVLF